MTGGELFLRRDQASRVNTEYLAVTDLDDRSETVLTELLRDYAAATHSTTAKGLLDDPARLREDFVRAAPLGR